MLAGFAFVYMEDERDGQDAIRALDRTEFGYKRRLLRVEWAKKMEVTGKNQAPTNTLFVVNFDVRNTRESDIERFFDKYGPLARVEIKRNYAFVEYRDVDDAIEAQKRSHGALMGGRTVTVEFVESSREKGGRDRSRSPVGGGRRRSPSPRGRGISPPGRYGRGSPRRRSPSPVRRRSRSPDYTRGGKGGSRSPGYKRRSPSLDRGRSP
ncbi:RNA recognition motif-containing protein [Scenedesmus sp. NREL 46B-D3]|nr:RNA recognition motif-containing protein [Scenedesmus sp. NREL 46B-D3]